MKLKKILFSLLAISFTTTVAVTTLSSCTGVSKGIMDNLVSRGNGGNFTNDTNGTNGITFQNALEMALTDKDATTAMKKSVVSQYLLEWYQKHAKTHGNFQNNLDTWNKSIDKDYDSQISSYKNNHQSNWQYFFQNEVLDPVGGTKDAWKHNQLLTKVHDEFVNNLVFNQATNNTYLSVPKSVELSNKILSGTLTPSDNFDVLHYMNPDDIKNPTTNVLSPSLWAAIGFYPEANPQYKEDDVSNNLDKYYAQIQQENFDLYCKYEHPLASGMTLWKYTKPSSGDMTSIYNKDVINNTKSSTNNTVGDDPTPLSEPSIKFPYFEVDGNRSGPNDKFNTFAKDLYADLDLSNGKYGKTLDYGISEDFSAASTHDLGLITINKTATSDDSSCVFPLTEAESITSAFETFAPEIFELWNRQGNTPLPADNSYLPTNIINPLSYDKTGNSGITPDIMKNFLFTGAAGVNPLPAADLPGTVASTNPAFFQNNTYATWASAAYTGLNQNVIDLADLYNNYPSGGIDHINLFNKDSEWYKNGYRYFVPAFRIAATTTAPGGTSQPTNVFPYVMILNTAGVHILGLDGLGVGSYQAPLENGYLGRAMDIHEGSQFSQDRMNNLLKFRSLYEMYSTRTAYSGTGLSLVAKDHATKDGGALKTWFSSHADDVILQTIERNKDFWLDADQIPEPIKLFNLLDSINQLLWFQDAISKYDAANKKLLDWGQQYGKNILKPKASTDKDIKEDRYSNGLAFALPYQVIGGVNDSATTTEFNELSKTHYKVVSDSMLWMFTPYYGIPKDANTILLNIKTNYETWSNTYDVSSTNSNDTKDYQKYSEHLLVKSNNGKVTTYLNSLLWSALSKASFVNASKNATLFDYMAPRTSSSDTGAAGIEADYADALASQYYSKQLLTSSNNFVSYNNNASSTTFATYEATLKEQFKRKLTNNVSARSIFAANSDDINSNGNKKNASDDVLSYWTLLSTIKYLEGTDKKYDRFFTYMKNLIGSDKINNNAYIAWISKDNLQFNSDFDNTSPTIESIYGYHENYDGMFENKYQNTNNLDATTGKTYVSFDQYWNFADIPTGATAVETAMGFLGLQTKSHNSLPSGVSNALFSSYGSATRDITGASGTGGLGGLYNWNDKTQLENFINDSQSPSDLDALADKINSSIDLNSFTSVLNAVKTAKNIDDKRKALIEWIDDATDKDKYFNSYNAVGATPAYSHEIVDPISYSPVILDDGSTAVGTRTRFMSVNAYDFEPSSGNNTLANLEAKLGASVVKNLIVQAAMDTTQQTYAIQDAIRTIWGTNGNGITVYDRRFNDNLTENWVKDWKNKN